MYQAPIILSVIFSFVIIIVLIGSFSKILRERIRAKAEAGKKDDNYIDYDLRLQKLEERIANLETIVLEQEKYRKFSSL